MDLKEKLELFFLMQKNIVQRVKMNSYLFTSNESRLILRVRKLFLLFTHSN